MPDARRPGMWHQAKTQEALGLSEQARTNFRNLWHRLRRALPDADRFLSADELAVQRRGDAPCWLDVAAFEAGAKAAKASASPDDQIAVLEQATVAYGGELLPDCYSDWLLAERDRLAQAYGAAVSVPRLAAIECPLGRTLG